MSQLLRTSRFNSILNAYKIQKQLASLTSVPAQHYHGRKLIGNRDIVGYGFNGSYIYFDAIEMPYPAIRFREETDEIKALREKEKGDWKSLTLEEKRKRNKVDWFCLHLLIFPCFSVPTQLLFDFVRS